MPNCDKSVKLFLSQIKKEEINSMAWLNHFKRPENYAIIVIRWCILSVLMGIIGGLLGAGFHHVLHFVTHVRSEHMWLIYLLPLGYRRAKEEMCVLPVDNQLSLFDMAQEG